MGEATNFVAGFALGAICTILFLFHKGEHECRHTRAETKP